MNNDIKRCVAYNTATNAANIAASLVNELTEYLSDLADVDASHEPHQDVAIALTKQIETIQKALKGVAGY